MMTSVNTVALKMPPMTTVANGRWISAPGPCASAIGKKPTAAATAVMSTGRNRPRALSTAAVSPGERRRGRVDRSATPAPGS